ncbi:MULTISPECIES: sensor histidine kinase [unclassified Faecalibacillus]|uniref:sensor histidine kinase n=1 Tax=unclassified Faecalibacillus TaxID=2678890 RepID=UPI001D0A84C7|nr:MULTISPECIES: GHKL domain-containing protein [unclassified Faecalibacillus]MCB8540978.1 GHKL domain-containing protein [Faecalibacillus sp. TM498]MCB8558607.1 GHKL domain-containing protein [Faecalibacillus sp. TM111]
MMMTILFSNVLELLIFTFFYKSLLSPNNNNKHEYTIIYTLCFLTKCLSNFFNNIQINIAISFFTYLILILKFSNSKLIYKLLSLSIYEGLSIFSESITYHIFQLFPLANENELLQMFFSKFVLFLFIFLIKKYKYIIDEDYIDFKNSLLLSFQPLSIIIFIYVSNGEIIINSKNSALTIFSLVLLIISNLISFYIFGETIKKNKIKKELDFEKMRIKENEQYYTSLKKNIYDFKAYRHDLKHHFSTLKSMLYLKKYDEAYEFVNSLYDKTCELSDIRSGDEFIDLVLTSRLHKIYFFNIKMYFEIRPLDLSFINAMDLNTIYANIIDNAINSCEECKDRYIKIQTKTNNQYQIIKITNSCVYATEINGSFISTKKDNANHGFGLTNIQKAAKKYNGFAQFKFDTNSQEFITTIIFKNNTKKQ